MSSLAPLPVKSGLIDVLKERYDCPHFRILVIGRANAGKTTILEKVCNVRHGTVPVVYDRNGVEVTSAESKPTSPSWIRALGRTLDSKANSSTLMPSIYRGEHDIDHQITYHGSNFIFHDSRGFEAGAKDEMKVVKKFMKEKSSASKLKDRLHAIWYCIPMDSPRPLTSSELKFFEEGTGKVPLVVVFTKFDAQLIQELNKLDDIVNDDERWERARLNAEKNFQEDYLLPILNTKSAPKAFVRLENMNQPEISCPELSEKTADAIDIASLRQLFTSTQMSNLNLCVKDALRELTLIWSAQALLTWDDVAVIVMARFPHFWHSDWKYDKALKKSEGKFYYEGKGAGGRKVYRMEFELEALEAKIGERREFAIKFMGKILSLFDANGLDSYKINFKKPKTCQIITALLIILEQSFWMQGDFWEKVEKAFSQFKVQDFVQKLKGRISVVPHSQKDLAEFLYNATIKN